VAIVIPAEGAVLERVLQTAHSIAPEGLGGQAYARFDAAQRKLAWACRSQRRFALVDGSDVLAGAVQYDLAAVLDGRPVRVCGIGSIFSEPAHRDGGHAWELVERLLGAAARDGAALALLFSDMRHDHQPAGFEVVSMTEAELSVTQSSRGAPMTLIRGGEERDLAAIASMGQIRATPFRFHLDRDADFVQYAITKKRLLAGLGPARERQLHFFIAEEGITAAAYVVISVVGDAWTIEECGDRDPSGARVGAMLQALIAREPVERRPTIRAWLPPGLAPPQVAIVSRKPSPHVMMMRALGLTIVRPQLSDQDVLYWLGDLF
jgi:hypothetical protein